MADIQVNVSYAGEDNSIAIISAKGFIDTTTAPDLEKKLEEQLALNKYKIIVDLKNIDYVSSAGWGVFVSEIREIRENNGDLVLANMSPDVYDVYELMEFSSILKAFDSVEESIAYFTGEEIPLKKTSEKARRIPEPAASASSSGVKPGSSETMKQEEAAQSAGDVLSMATSELGRRILNVIIDNPYFEVKEIAKALRLPQYGGRKASTGSVKRELRSMGLLDRQKRLEIAMKGKG